MTRLMNEYYANEYINDETSEGLRHGWRNLHVLTQSRVLCSLPLTVHAKVLMCPCIYVCCIPHLSPFGARMFSFGARVRGFISSLGLPGNLIAMQDFSSCSRAPPSHRDNSSRRTTIL